MPSLVKITEPPYTWRVPRSELDSVRALLPTLSNPENRRNASMPVKETRYTSIYRMPGPRANTAVYIKIYLRDSWRYLVRTPPGTREAQILIKLQQIGVPVSDLLAVGVRRWFPFKIENVLVLRSPANLWTLGRWSLTEFRTHGEEGRRRVTPVLVRILAAVRRMHEAGIYHGDLNPGNVLIDPDGKNFFLIDFHRSRCLWPQKQYRCTEDISELLEYFTGYYSPTDIQDLICAYAPGGGALSHAIRELWETTRENRYERRVKTVVGQCCDSRTFFRSIPSGAATLYVDRQYSPEILLEFESGGTLPSAWRCEELKGCPETNRDSWRAAIRRSMIGEIHETPVALICRDPGTGQSLLIWDTEKEPLYRLSHMFSLDRFDPGGDHFLPKTDK
ncbi:MAG: lipopolysaccharide kinase InaA family protein [bacterium]